LQGPLQVGKMFNPLYSILLSQRSQPTCHMPWTEGSGSSIYLPLASFDYGFSNDWIGGGIGVLPDVFQDLFASDLRRGFYRTSESQKMKHELQLRWTFGMAMEGGRERERLPQILP
jgi:hypothetical protein